MRKKAGISGTCGCPDCKKGDKTPHTRNQWMGRKNSHGNAYGSFKNPSAKHGGGNKGGKK